MMLCPYHGDYNSRLDRCPACVESRANRAAAPMWTITPRRTEFEEVLAECDAIEANARIYSPKDPALPFDTGRLLVVQRIREILGR